MPAKPASDALKKVHGARSNPRESRANMCPAVS